VKIILDLETTLRHRRLLVALTGYAALAAAAWLLLEGVFRAAVWIFVAGLAVMTLARAKWGGGDGANPEDEGMRG